MKKWIFGFITLLAVTSSACNPVNDLFSSTPNSDEEVPVSGKAAGIAPCGYRQ
jgi:hypothetical protein